MSIAKGRTDCEAERDTIMRGFNDLLMILKQSKNQTEVQAKSTLYDIIHNKCLSDEERLTQMSPLNALLTEQEELDIRIRSTILIGLFSFWELSLKAICEYYKIDISCFKGKRKESKSPNKKIDYSVNDYINAIFHSRHPKNIDVISSEIKELRNYMTHGNAKGTRKSIIENLILKYPEFCIAKSPDGYFITSYDGMDNILKIINDGLMCAEAAAKSLT